jgi:hypothetical protein
LFVAAIVVVVVSLAIFRRLSKGIDFLLQRFLEKRFFLKPSHWQKKRTRTFLFCCRCRRLLGLPLHSAPLRSARCKDPRKKMVVLVALVGSAPGMSHCDLLDRNIPSREEKQGTATSNLRAVLCLLCKF